ncbi:ABC transporter substrate-binding protein [Beijerinckia mobilis]|uniref:ABC transporter substrate-binding protein n=1 Tax=Beijerinckia mobilis TaxID=231434 RepID=UPI001FDA83EE|nr:ABC transporter substrate-binding protein [Beijerinckia mobilis]
MGLVIPFGLSFRTDVAAGPNRLAPLVGEWPLCRTAASGDAAAGAPAVGPLRKINFAWNATAACLPTIPAALDKGYFAKNGLDVSLINYSGSTDQLLETLATGKADAAVGMALRWLKPLEQGFDVKIVAGLHGGCLRLLAPKASGISALKDLKGKTIAVSDTNSPARNFFAILLKKAGVDPEHDVDYKIYPQPLLRAAVEKGEAQACADGDPYTYSWLKDGTFAEVSSNMRDDYAQLTCCIIGVSGKLLREDKKAVAALVRSLLDAGEFTAAHPDESAAALAPYVTSISVAELAGLARYHTHHAHPVGADLKRELTHYAQDLKLIDVLKRSTDPARYADRIVVDVLSS